MSAKAIREATGKTLLNQYLGPTAVKCNFVSLDFGVDWPSLILKHPWIEKEVLCLTVINLDNHLNGENGD